jgi:hypothetical protein
MLCFFFNVYDIETFETNVTDHILTFPEKHKVYVRGGQRGARGPFMAHGDFLTGSDRKFLHMLTLKRL